HCQLSEEEAKTVISHIQALNRLDKGTLHAAREENNTVSSPMNENLLEANMHKNGNDIFAFLSNFGELTNSGDVQNEKSLEELLFPLVQSTSRRNLREDPDPPPTEYLTRDFRFRMLVAAERKITFEEAR